MPRCGPDADELWSRNITITTVLVDTSTTGTLLEMLAAHRLDAAALVTHRFRLHEMMEAYDAPDRQEGSLSTCSRDLRL